MIKYFKQWIKFSNFSERARLIFGILFSLCWSYLYFLYFALSLMNGNESFSFMENDFAALFIPLTLGLLTTIFVDVFFGFGRTNGLLTIWVDKLDGTERDKDGKVIKKKDNE